MQPLGSGSNVITKKPLVLLPPPEQVIAEVLSINAITIEFLAGDGSDRCYYRILSPELKSSLVLMQLSQVDAKKLRDNGYDWVAIGQSLVSHGITVPRVCKTIPEWAALIIEDYGNVMFETVMFDLIKTNNLETIEHLYLEATKIVGNMLTIPRSQDAVWCQRKFDTEKFLWEMNFFKKYFLQMVCNVELNQAENEVFQKEILLLSEFLAADSKWFTHRDYHSRNIMVKDNRLALIDFQDARLGPAAYDLVSLCFDSYVPLSSDLRLRLLDSGIQTIKTITGDAIAKEIKSHWPAMLLQRQLKAIGSFGYLTKEKMRGNYLKYVTPALETLEQAPIKDNRWPFLSSTLINIMKRSYR